AECDRDGDHRGDLEQAVHRGTPRGLVESLAPDPLLGCRARLRERALQHGIGAAGRSFLEPATEQGFDVRSLVRHGRPPAITRTGRASASSVARMDLMAY